MKYEIPGAWCEHEIVTSSGWACISHISMLHVTLEMELIAKKLAVE